MKSIGSKKNFDEYYAKLNDIFNSNFNLGERYSKRKIVRKILRSLLKRFKPRFTAIEEINDLDALKVDGMWSWNPSRLMG